MRGHSDLTLVQAKYRLKRIAQSVGMTRGANKLTLYSLRHEFSEWMYQHITGSKSPVLGGQLDKETDVRAREVISGYLGHHRHEVTGAYTGTVTTMHRLYEKRLKEIRERFLAPHVVERLREAGAQQVLIAGAAARGEPMGDSVLVVVVGKPGCEEPCLLIIREVLKVVPVSISQAQAEEIGDTFEVF